MKKIKSIKVLLFILKKYAQRKTINVEIIEDNEANLNIKAKTTQDIPKIKKNL